MDQNDPSRLWNSTGAVLTVSVRLTVAKREFHDVDNPIGHGLRLELRGQQHCFGGTFRPIRIG